MHLVRATDTVPYRPPGHHGVDARRLQGLEAGGPEDFWVAVSHYPPGATVDATPTTGDTVYVLLAGELRLTAHDDPAHDKGRTVTLLPQDSVHLAAGEVRSLRNDSDAAATLLVVLMPPAHPAEGEPDE